MSIKTKINLAIVRQRMSAVGAGKNLATVNNRSVSDYGKNKCTARQLKIWSKPAALPEWKHQIPQVKQKRARTVLGWETA